MYEFVPFVFVHTHRVCHLPIWDIIYALVFQYEFANLVFHGFVSCVLKEKNHKIKNQVVGVKTQLHRIAALIQYIRALQPVLEIF